MISYHDFDCWTHTRHYICISSVFFRNLRMVMMQAVILIINVFVFTRKEEFVLATGYRHSSKTISVIWGVIVHTYIEI